MNSILDALGAARYAQHSICLTNDPIMLFLYSGADFFTFVCYFVIGGALWFDTGGVLRAILKYQKLFGAFILLCGLSHLTMVIVLFEGIYRLDVVVRVAMAAVSVVTAVFLIEELHRERMDKWEKRP